MLTKRPKSFFRQYIVKAGKIAIAAELAGLALSYFGWRQLNNNQGLKIIYVLSVIYYVKIFMIYKINKSIL